MHRASQKLLKISLFSLLTLFATANGQGLSNFLGHWTGLELLDSPNLTYDNRNISLIVSEGGDRDGFHIYTSSCDFLYNEDLDWAYHYFGFDKEYTQVIFLRRFITPLGVIGYEELVYDLTEWSDESFVAEYLSDDGGTYHEIRMDIDILRSQSLIPCVVKLSQNFPNPFNPTTSMYVSVDKESIGSLVIFNLKGQAVRTLHKGRLATGITNFIWDGNDNSGRPVSGGAYIYRLMLDGVSSQSQKMILLK